MNKPVTVTQLLRAWREGDAAALDALTPEVYETLHRLAQRQMRGERARHTLQATALVHEAFERLVDMEVSWQDRAHFYAVAARLMRRILVDHARSARRQKRGGGASLLSLDEAIHVVPTPDPDLVDLDEALQRLSDIDARKGQVVELHFFGGLTYDETAEALGISAATVDRELRFAKAWLYRALQDEGPPA
jgi:RNA polymerase sigma factor (TIGR02999 family)